MANLVSSIFDLYILVVIVRVVMSWIGVQSGNQIVQFIYDVTEPVLSKIRGVVPPIAGLDLSPVVLIIALSLIRNILFPGY